LTIFSRVETRILPFACPEGAGSWLGWLAFFLHPSGAFFYGFSFVPLLEKSPSGTETAFFYFPTAGAFSCSLRPKRRRGGDFTLVCPVRLSSVLRVSQHDRGPFFRLLFDARSLVSFPFFPKRIENGYWLMRTPPFAT